MADQKNKLAIYTSSVILVFLCVFVMTSCVCPIFSYIERRTGIEVSAGQDIDTGFIPQDLIYPGSNQLIEVSGDIEDIISTASELGMEVGQEERAALSSLPESMRDEEIRAVIYHSDDGSEEIWEYYASLGQRGWTTSSYQSGSADSGSLLFFMFREEERQPVLVNTTGNRSFIIFIDYDWDSLEE